MCRITSNQTPITSIKEPQTIKPINKTSNENNEAKENNKSNFLDPNDAFKGGCKLPDGIHPTPIDLTEIIGKLEKFEPKSIVENIRNAKGGDRDNALLGFQNKIDNMSKFDLKSMRDYLVKEMANPKNKDDELLGSLLNRVNKELDSRGNRPSPFPGPGPIGPIRPFPEPIICGPFPWEKKFPDDKIVDFGLEKNDSIKENHNSHHKDSIKELKNNHD